MAMKRIEAAFRPLEQHVSKPAAASFAGVPAEVVAAISGAIACLCGGNATVVGIRPSKRDRSGRSAWSMAGLLDNTRAF